MKKFVKVAVAAVMALACSVTMFACQQESESQIDANGVLPTQIENQRYYFKQGKRDDWKVVAQGEDGYMINDETGLVIELAPCETTKDSEGNVTAEGAAIDGVEYAVYYYTTDSINMTSTRNDIISWLLDETNEEFYFNAHHTIDGNARETYLCKGDVETFTAQYSKLQFSKVAYTFTRDGEDWQGVFNLVTSGREYFIVTYEAKADLYDEYLTAYEETIGDFRKIGWETSAT